MPYSFTATLVGTSYVEKNYRSFCSGMDHGIQLEFEPKNPSDHNAVKVLGGRNRIFIGYLDRESAARIHRLKSKHPTAEAIFSGSECYMLNVTLEVDAPAKKKALQTGIFIDENTVIGCVVKTKISPEQLQHLSGELAIIPEGDTYSIRTMDSGNQIGMLDSKTASILNKSETKITECFVSNFADDHLFVKITASSRLLSDLEWQRKMIIALFQKMPEYLGYHFGDNPPTERQFSYGLALGIDMRKQTFQGVSKAIDKAKAKSIPARHTLTVWEEEELYRYLSRTSNQRYAFLDGLENSPWRSKERLRPVKTPSTPFTPSKPSAPSLIDQISESVKKEWASRPKPKTNPPPPPEPAIQSCKIQTDFKTECPFCSQHYEAAADMNGTKFQCIKCGKEFTLRIDLPKYVHAQCPKCKTTSIFPPDSMDKKLECPKCHKIFVKNSPGTIACGCIMVIGIAFFILWLCSFFK